jgi:DNA-binding NarL/FixJ family response regulator
VPARAATIFGAAERLREHLGAAKPPQWRSMLEPLVGEVRAALGEAAFMEAWAAGRALTPDEAVVVFERPAAAAAARAAGIALTTRERDVLQWVAAGLSDAQVAEKLVISVRTVNAHLQSIYNKLGVNSRTAAVRVATQQMLV